MAMRSAGGTGPMRCCPASRSADVRSATIVIPDKARLDGRASGAPSFGSGDAVATGRLFLWSAARGEWVSCPPDEITWLDRRTLSGDEDLTLHRAPRCAGLRYVHHRWELFSRDTTYRVYLAPEAAGTLPSAEVVQRTARHVLPAAPARYEALPVILTEGSWLVSVGTWVLRLRLDAPPDQHADPAVPDDGLLLPGVHSPPGRPAGGADDECGHRPGPERRGRGIRL